MSWREKNLLNKKGCYYIANSHLYICLAAEKVKEQYHAKSNKESIASLIPREFCRLR